MAKKTNTYIDGVQQLAPTAGDRITYFGERGLIISVPEGLVVHATMDEGDDYLIPVERLQLDCNGWAWEEISEEEEVGW